MEYSNREKTDMHYCYGMAEGNSEEASRLYERIHPNARQPHPQIFARIHRQLSESGQFGSIRMGVVGRVVGPGYDEVADEVLRRVEADPSISTRRLAAEFNVSHVTIWQIIHSAGLYPYHLQRVQALYPGDHARRLAFCQWLIAQNDNHYPNFAWKILFTDEAQFTRDGINNFHNKHLWDFVNPHGIVEGRNQRQFSCNVWAGILGNNLFGPVFLPPRLNGQNYHNFLVNTLRTLFGDVSLDLRQNMWFMHDGAPAHFAIIVRNLLDRPNYFHNRWIGRGGPIEWPPRSPDMNPLDFFFWGYCKSLVYARPVDTVEELRERIEAAFETIANADRMLDRVNESIYRRANACIFANGGHFEQFL